MKLVGFKIFCLLLILPMLCRSLEVDSQDNVEEENEQIVQKTDEDVKNEEKEVEEKGGKRKSKQFWPLIHTRVSPASTHVISHQLPVVSSHHYVRQQLPQVPYSMFKYSSQYSNPLSNNNNNNNKAGEPAKTVAARRIQLEDDVRVAEVDAFDAHDDVSIVESVNRMLADAQRINAMKKQQTKAVKKAKSEDKIIKEGEDAEGEEDDMEKKDDAKDGDDKPVDYKIEGRQGSLNGADISSDIFANQDDLILPGSPLLDPTTTGTRPNLAQVENLPGAPQLSSGGTHLGIGPGRHDFHHDKHAGHHDLHHNGGGIGHHLGHGVHPQQCCLFVFFDGSAYYFDDYLRLLTGPYRLMYGTVNGRPHYVARGCKDPDAYGPNCSYIWNSGYGWIIGIGTYIGQTKGVIYTRADGACPTANTHSRWRYLNKDHHWKENGNIVLECAS